MNRREPSENAKLFIEKLKKLTAGEKARLKLSLIHISEPTRPY
mgnify:CR=1 FL=1